MGEKVAQGSRVFVTPTQGRTGWADAAHDLLIDTARQYNGLVTDAELADQVQAATGKWTRTPAARWLPAVLEDVAVRCALSAEPPLPSLVVSRRDLAEPIGYHAVLASLGRRVPDARTTAGDGHSQQLQAAAARLQCYVRWCRDLPLDARPHLPAPRR